MIWSGSGGAWARFEASVGVLFVRCGNGRWRGFCGLVGNVGEVLGDELRGVWSVLCWCLIGEGVAAVMPLILGSFAVFMLAYSSK